MNSSKMIGNFPAVLNFNPLFLKLNRFICNLLLVLPDPSFWSCAAVYELTFPRDARSYLHPFLLQPTRAFWQQSVARQFSRAWAAS